VCAVLVVEVWIVMLMAMEKVRVATVGLRPGYGLTRPYKATLASIQPRKQRKPPDQVIFHFLLNPLTNLEAVTAGKPIT
jgi:hypothetical protein